jgi:hypothetical protein
MFRGRRKPCIGSRPSPWRWRETLNTCVVQPPDGRASRAKPSQHTLPEDDGAWPQHSGKNGQNPLLGRVCRLTTGGLIRVRQCYCPLDQILPAALAQVWLTLPKLHQALEPQSHVQASYGQKMPVKQCQGHCATEGPARRAPLTGQKTVRVQGEAPRETQYASEGPQ